MPCDLSAMHNLQRSVLASGVLPEAKREPLIARVARKILGNLKSLAFGLGAAAQAVLGCIISKLRALL